MPVRTIVVGNAGGQTSVANELPRYAGSIASSFESEVAFRVPGRVATRRANLGEFVQAGAALATLDPSPFAIAARSTDAAVAAARAEVAQAEAEFARNAPLAADRIVAPAQLDRLRAQRDAARARLADAQARTAGARDDLGYATLRAPTTGVVTQVTSEVGQYLAAGQVAFRIARPNTLDVVVDVPESVVATVRPGMPAVISLASSSAPVAGRIREVAPAADPATRTYRVKVALGTIGAARIGMTASVAFPAASSGGAGGPRQSPAVPLTAIAQKGKRPALWVVKPNGSLELRPVTLGAFADTSVTIPDGVRQGERIVTAGVHRLDARQRVRLWDGRLP